MAKTTILLTGDLLRSVFDAAKDQLFRFTYSGDQVVRNRLTIRENSSGAIVFNREVDSMRLEHLLPARSLTNGRMYSAYIAATYRKGDGSLCADTPSEPIVFSCLATPVVTFFNLTEGQVIANSAYGLTINYAQEQGDLPNRYTIKLYNSGRQVIWTCDGYSSSMENDATLTETISNLFNSQQYYVSCDFESVGGMQGSTGLVMFIVQYAELLPYSTVYLENMPSQYAIRIRSNIKIVDSTIEGPDPTYIDNQMIDLSNGETRVSWSNFGPMESDFQIMLEISHGPEVYRDIMEMSNGEHTIKTMVMKGLLYGERSERIYAVLYSEIGGDRYMTMSNTIGVPDKETLYYLSVVRNGQFYKVILHEKKVGG